MDNNKVFKLVKPDIASGHAQALPLIFDSPHSGAHYPSDFDYACDFSVLRQAEDRYVDDLYSMVPDYGGALLSAQFPRSYIDANRAVDDIDPALLGGASWPEDSLGAIFPTSRSDAGIGLIHRLAKPGIPIYARSLTPSEIMQRIKNYYNPYHKKLSELIDNAHNNYGVVWYVNCHSMPDASAVPRNPIGIVGRDRPRSVDFVLGDRDGTTCNIRFTHMVRDFLRGLGYRVSVNDPFKGVELVRRYSNPARGRYALQIEVNKALYMNEVTGRKNRNYNTLKSDIDKLIEFLSGYVQSQLVQQAAD